MTTEAQRAAMKTWRTNNAAHIKEYEDRTREHNRQRKRARYKANLEAFHATQQAAYHANPQRQVVNTRNWRARHPEKKRIYKANRRARKRNALMESVSLNTLYIRDSKKCSICHRHVYLKDASIDHIIPLSRGGSHTYKNCVLTHYLCNVKKGYRRIPPQQLRLF